MRSTVSNLLIGLGLAAAAAGAQAAILTTVDLSAVEGTSWNNANTQAVRVDFGAGYGLGTITITGINGGTYGNVAPAYTGEPLLNYALSNGNVLNRTTESIFTLPTGSASPNGTLSGVAVTFTLDSGTFGDGGLFMIRSLDWHPTNGVRQYFSNGAGLMAPLPDALASDFGNATGNVVAVGSDSDGTLWSTDTIGTVSKGAAFQLADDVNQFSFRLLATQGYGGGIAFSFALDPSQVPEPTTLALGGLAIAGLGLMRARRRVALAPVRA